MFSKKLPQCFASNDETQSPASLDLWYQERHPRDKTHLISLKY